MNSIPFLVLLAPLAGLQEAAPEFEPLPQKRFPELPGTCVVLLVGNPNPITMLDGRSGASDALCVSSDRSSYRWACLPDPQGTGVRVRVPAAGKEESPVFKGCSPATIQKAKGFGVQAADCLVEVEINGGRGAAEGADTVVLTRLKAVEGTAEYPIHVAETVGALRRRHQEHLREQSAAIDRRMEEGRKAAVGDRRPTDPREEDVLTYLTWKTDPGRLEVRFRTRFSEGVYGHGGGAATADGKSSGGRWGTQWTVEVAMSATADRAGQVSTPAWSELKLSQRELPPMPSAPPRR